MSLSNIELSRSFSSKKVVKVIAGINNTKVEQVIKIAMASQLAGADYLDINANVNLVKLLKSFISLPLCISSVDPVEIYNCVSSGADLIEVGNYDIFYKKSIYITSQQLINLVKEIKALIGNYDICVTIPYYMNLHEQISLAQNLEYLGVSMLQTEGTFLNNKVNKQLRISKPLFSSLLSTHVLSKYVNIPIITSSCLTSISSNMPIYYGASGIGIGSSVKSQNSLLSMVSYIKDIKCSISNEFYDDLQVLNTNTNADYFTNFI